MLHPHGSALTSLPIVFEFTESYHSWSSRNIQNYVPQGSLGTLYSLFLLLFPPA